MDPISNRVVEVLRALADLRPEQARAYLREAVVALDEAERKALARHLPAGPADEPASAVPGAGAGGGSALVLSAVLEPEPEPEPAPRDRSLALRATAEVARASSGARFCVQVSEPPGLASAHKDLSAPTPAESVPWPSDSNLAPPPVSSDAPTQLDALPSAPQRPPTDADVATGELVRRAVVPSAWRIPALAAGAAVLLSALVLVGFAAFSSEPSPALPLEPSPEEVAAPSLPTPVTAPSRGKPVSAPRGVSGKTVPAKAKRTAAVDPFESRK